VLFAGMPTEHAPKTYRSTRLSLWRALDACYSPEEPAVRNYQAPVSSSLYYVRSPDSGYNWYAALFYSRPIIDAFGPLATARKGAGSLSRAA
jgi:hypothetical protein